MDVKVKDTLPLSTDLRYVYLYVSMYVCLYVSLFISSQIQ